jgi:hypothetical protein
MLSFVSQVSRRHRWQCLPLKGWSASGPFLSSQENSISMSLNVFLRTGTFLGQLLLATNLCLQMDSQIMVPFSARRIFSWFFQFTKFCRLCPSREKVIHQKSIREYVRSLSRFSRSAALQAEVWVSLNCHHSMRDCNFKISGHRPTDELPVRWPWFAISWYTQADNAACNSVHE